MLLCSAEILSADKVRSLVAQLNPALFVDGKLTAGWHARLVKHNTQLKDDGMGLLQDLQQHILQALKRHPLFEMAARPKGVRSPLFSRYPSGMCYGTHLDTHSLSVLTLHRVESVTQGVRLAAVTWVQSWVQDGGDREILFDLDTARQALFAKDGKTLEFDLISKSHANLLRKWADL